VVTLDECRKVRLVGDVEEDGQRSGDEADDAELDVRDVRDRGGDGQRAECERAADIGGDEDGPARNAVDPRSGGQREQQEREKLDRAEQRDVRAKCRARGPPDGLSRGSTDASSCRLKCRLATAC